MEIIDFHTHPFYDAEHNICNHKEYCGMSVENTREIFKTLGISKICGSVIRGTQKGEDIWQKVLENNNMALKLKEIYGDFYIPGFHVHPDYVEESINEVKRMHEKGINLVGEIVPYYDGWKDYSCKGFSEILDEIEKYNMVVNIHSMGEDEMDKMVKEHPGIVFVAAHPGEYTEFMRHIERAKLSENYYIDLSGYGVFRYGMLRRAIDCIGIDRILFGSDFPTCNPAMYLGAVTLEPLISDTEREKILSLNAKKLLNLK